jgi:FkbH-like protein
MKTFSDIKRNLRVDAANLPVIKVALLGDTATQLLAIALRGSAIEKGYSLALYEEDYDQIERQLLVSQSEYYAYGAKYNIVFQSTQKLLNIYNASEHSQREHLADERIAFVRQICTACNETIIYCNYPEIDDTVYGNYANKTRQSFIYQVRKLNYELMRVAESTSNLFICDLEAIQTKYGRKYCYDSSIYMNGDMVISMESLPQIAARLMDIIGACQGNIKKCVIIDLDNTIWGGNIGDDGVGGIQIGQGQITGKIFSEIQHWLKKLRERGIILAVCSKNEYEVAKKPFMKHPDMVLRFDDIAVFMANWNSKADNIRQIQAILNIGMDSMIFLDDNPVERAMVRENIPDMVVPELPGDPSDYLEYLYDMNLFETASLSEHDQERTKMYQNEYARTQAMKRFDNKDEFLKSLEMKATVHPFRPHDIPRIAELTQRSNQFNLRTVRYSEADVVRLSKQKRYQTYAYDLKDRYGDYGVICIIVMKKRRSGRIFIENWVMSCRVLKRGMETFVMNKIVSYARNIGCKYLIGEYASTNKNKMVDGHYYKYGFKNLGQNKGGRKRYIMDVNEYKAMECCVEEVNEQ